MAYHQYITTIFLSLQFLMCYGNSELEITTSVFATKTIQSEHGQIFDCVNANSQPSLQQSKLKDHMIQASPTFPENGFDPDLKQKFSYYEEAKIKGIACPVGSVPVLRNNRGGIEVARSLKMLEGNKENESNGTVHTVMVATYPATFHGAQAMITVYEPNLGIGNPPRYSGAVVLIQNGVLPNISTIYAGWFVDPHVYGDKHAHFEIAWSDKDRSCTNLLCQGFVQVSSKVAPGAIVKPVSTINGSQYVIAVSMFQDATNGSWWLTFGKDGHAVGYWPKELFTYMADSANIVALFGATGAAVGEPCPPMGSGEWPDAGEGKAADFLEVKFVDQSRNVVVPELKDCVVQITDPKCYQVGRVNALRKGLHFYFGGPGCQPTG